MKKYIGTASRVLLTLILLSSALPMRVRAEEYAILRDTATVRVLQVIDGDAFKVYDIDNNATALVRLAGIATDGYGEAFKYTASQLLGREVELIPVNMPNSMRNGRWTPAYIYCEQQLYNRVLLQKGLARVDAEYNYLSLYQTFLRDETLAMSRRVGIWAPDEVNYQTYVPPTSVSTTDRVNINTATAQQLQNYLEITSSSARDIVRYRESNPYNVISEIKFSGGLSREEYAACLHILTVCTNVNTANNEELRIAGFTAAEARALINRRGNFRFVSVEELRTEGVVTSARLRELEPFIDVRDNDTVELTVPAGKTADINTASAADIYDAGRESGITQTYADLIAAARAKGYTFKSLGEIQFIQGISLTAAQINQLADNLLVRPGYDMYNVPSFVNLNTASAGTIASAGFSSEQAAQIVAARPLRSGRDLPFTLTSVQDSSCTLYTNINAVTSAELMGLSGWLSPYFASVLVNASERQPFGTASELSAFFAEYDETSLYRSIRDYIVLR